MKTMPATSIMTKACKCRVLITGAGQGIGFAVAAAFLEKGCSVVIVGRTKEKLDAACGKLTAGGGKVSAVVADVTDPQQVERLAREIEERFGRLDVLVNCIGNFVFAATLEHSWDQWRDVIDSNLSSVFLVVKEMVPLLRKSDRGRIINIAASYASIQKAFPKWGPYAAAKAGVVSLTKTLAVELAPYRITVNVISPGLIDTGAYDGETKERWSEAVPAGRFGEPEEVARAALFLASAESGYITGSELAVSGGWEGELP